MSNIEYFDAKVIADRTETYLPKIESGRYM